MAHVFAVTHGDHKLIEEARAKGCAVVVSGLLNRVLVPPDTFTLRIGRLVAEQVGIDAAALRATVLRILPRRCDQASCLKLSCPTRPRFLASSCR